METRGEPSDNWYFANHPTIGISQKVHYAPSAVYAPREFSRSVDPLKEQANDLHPG
jgi:hypothetical protein